MKRPVRDAAAAFAAESPRIFIDARVTPATASRTAVAAEGPKAAGATPKEGSTRLTLHSI
jgi:hypothetical protein